MAIHLSMEGRYYEFYGIGLIGFPDDPFTELFYVLNGTGTFQTETQTFCIAADDLILINPHVMHTEFSNGDAALEYVVLGFEGIAFETDGHAPITCLCKNVKTIRPACLFYTRSLIQELHDRKENYVEMSQNLLENLLYLIRREIRVTPEAVSVGKTCLLYTSPSPRDCS